jgi:hypothetical protein
MAEKRTKLDNGRTLQPGATPLGTATRGEIGLFGEHWYDNNGDEVPLSSNPEMEAKYGKRPGRPAP